MKTKARSAKWSKEVMQVYQKYPAAFRSNKWPEIVRLANAGDLKAAQFLAVDHQDKSKAHRAENIIARRLRIQRVQLIKVQREKVAQITSEFEAAGMALANRMIHLPNTVSAMAPMKRATREVIVTLRRRVRALITDLVWSSILLGVKNMGEAIKPILRDNAEAFADELKDVALIEARLSMGMDQRFARRTDGGVNMGSDKWQAIVDKIYEQITLGNLNGLTLSERIWDLTARAEMEIRRIIAGEIAKGTSSRDIADRIQKYIYVEGIDDNFSGGPGVYRSPLMNALRLARTETNRAYTQATAAWADNKAWIKSIRVTLSPAHKVEDDCDEIAGEEYSPEEFADVLPVHPHCMCFGVYVIDEDFLTGNDTGDTPEGETSDE